MPVYHALSSVTGPSRNSVGTVKPNRWYNSGGAAAAGPDDALPA